MMQITTQFDLGQILWKLRIVSLHKPCNECCGTAKIIIGTTKYLCSRCNGKGEEAADHWAPKQTSKVTQINAKRWHGHDHRGRSCVHEETEYIFSGDDDYTAHERYCFATEEDALEAADIMNEEREANAAKR